MAYEDLLKDTSASFEDGNYFVVTITDLTPGTIYPLEFRWKYKDGTFAEWGCVKTIISPIQSTPKRPSFSQSDLSYFQGILTVTWSGKDFTNNSYGAVFDRVDVYVASDASPGVFTVRGSIKVPGGKLEIPVEPGTYYVKLKTIFKPDSQSIFSDNTYSITAKADAPSIPLSVSSSWSGTDFNVSFTHDASATSNKYFSYYKITLTGGGVTRTFNLSPVTGSSQLFALSLAKNRAAFGVPQTTFSGSVASIDVYGNSSSSVSFPSTSYVNSLPSPIISATEIQQGYSISYTTPTSATYDHIEIEEIESNAATAPTTGYSVIFSGVANPAPIIRPNQNKRWVRARFADNIGSFSAYSSAIAATPLSPVTVDNVPPSAPASGTVTAGIDNSTGATVGFNAYLNISWNAVSDSTLRGYRIRFRENGTTNPYSYVDSPGTGTTFRLNGLSIGTTYEVGVASYDEYNNTSSAYTSVGTATATGTPFIGKNVTTVGYFGASATGDTGTFKFGYGVQDSGGTKRGLVFNSNNYWYIDSAQSALFKLGGDTNNYIEWNGSTFVVQGDIRAKAGNFSGNVQIQSGGSLYSGTLTQAGALSGAGFILNNSGLTFNSSSVNGITTINGTTGLFTTSSANIGGWNVTSSSIAKTSTSGTITLNSSNAQITLSSTSYNAGIATPDTNSSTDIVFWAGGGRSTAANFYVRADGTVKMTSAIIDGYATDGELSLKADQSSLTATNNTVATKVSNSQVKDHIGGTNVSTISGGVITTGIVKSSNFPGANSQAADGSGFSTSGAALNLDNGTITSPKFRINTSGSAFFTGTVVAEAFTLSNTGGDYWSVTPGSTSSGFRFGGSTGIQYSGSGKITLGTNTEIYGDLLLNTYNYWKPSNNTFNVGDSTKFINWNGSSLTVTGNISGSTISGGSINITGETFSNPTTDDSGAAGDISSQSNAFTSNYPRTPLGYFSAITTVGFNAVSLISTTTAGVVSSWYPYYDGASDLGVKYSTTYGTAPYRWRNLRLTGIAYFGGDGYSNTLSSSTPTSTDIKIAINSSGTIYANLLGTGTGGTIVQNSNGFLKVQSSSRKYKENIISISGNYLNSILQLNPVNFNYKEEFSGTSENPTISGLIAEEVAEIAQLSGIINYNNEGEPESVSYERLTVFLAKAIKELSERLDVLEG